VKNTLSVLLVWVSGYLIGYTDGSNNFYLGKGLIICGTFAAIVMAIFVLLTKKIGS